MGEPLNPIIYWGQNKDFIFLKVELSELEDLDVKMNYEELHFKTSATGINGQNMYACTIKFYLYIDADKSKYRITDRNIEFQIRKEGSQIWPRLTYDPVKPAWLKIDFDRFMFDDEDEETTEDEMVQNEEAMKKLEKELGLTQKPNYIEPKILYMVMYNLFQWVGYSMIVAILLYNFMIRGKETRMEAFALVGNQLRTVQACAVLEVLHPLLGWVKTGPFMPLIQVFGRNMIVFMIMAQEETVAQFEVVWWLIMTWSSVELIRYPYYMLQTINKDVGLVTWLRYTVWIVLYPAGFIFEGVLMMFALPFFERNGKWTVSLPNQFNISFHFPTFLKIYMVLFLGGAYMLMTRMYEQRKKKLGVGYNIKKSKKKVS